MALSVLITMLRGIDWRTNSIIAVRNPYHLSDEIKWDVNKNISLQFHLSRLALSNSHYAMGINVVCICWGYWLACIFYKGIHWYLCHCLWKHVMEIVYFALNLKPSACELITTGFSSVSLGKMSEHDLFLEKCGGAVQSSRLDHWYSSSLKIF